MAEERRIALRIGVNLGDVVVEDDDLLGDGVNVAARLEQLCPPGGVLISGSAHDHLSGKLDVRFEYAGEQRLKNIARPVRTYQMALAGFPSPVPTSCRADKPAVAVLPFENMSGDPEQIYFSDGMTEDVITELSRFRELTVIARNSTFSFRGQSVDVRDVGRSLGAEYVVEGSVRRAGDRVRITAQLVDAANGLHLWAERYDRALKTCSLSRRRLRRASSRQLPSASETIASLPGGDALQRTSAPMICSFKPSGFPMCSRRKRSNALRRCSNRHSRSIPPSPVPIRGSPSFT